MKTRIQFHCLNDLNYFAGTAEDLEADKFKLEKECGTLKKEIEGFEASLKKAEQDKKEKDNQIKDLQSEMADREEKIGETMMLSDFG